MKHDWNNICGETEVNKAYNLFLDVLQNIYDKNCASEKVKTKRTTLKILG